MPLPGTEGRPLDDMAPWRTWPAAATGALRYLHGQSSWDVWMVTRLVGERQIVLSAEPGDAIRPGASLPWAESFCRYMVSGEAPRVATVTAAVPEYASRVLPNGMAVAAYLGVPLIGPDDVLFGTLCAVGGRARPRSAARDLPAAEVVARMLSSLLTAGMDPGPMPEPLSLSDAVGPF
ncbi:GAF domain-containing protein [Blastococcus sp. TF02A-26]|uniref:GAF domain-containing protein n=1 Tax=Blastococcus sp. TF02A-26 TaxID=2250577 RepID=UPI000DE9A155|nr:GAF domain-containing protein [Blastococcus sp. TF02A-26]RBY79942.1 histidine kinase [Blastococcus sp. TF02A-26]